ncbi:MAG: stage 0 sporulation family protein [Acutalibacteraceae bacterium]
MACIIGVRFRDVGKIYYFDPDGETFKNGDRVIVETSRGVECGEVAMENRIIDDSDISYPLKKIIRTATDDDLKKVAENREKEKKAFDICVKKIEQHKLKMKLVNVEYTFDNNKILFYFTADGRVDFRDLVKDLAYIFRTRIELRQIGVRDESKMLGGIGICGRPFCCNTFLGDFQPVSIKMAKEQGMSLNPVKISGTCGRLMCCLKYEQEAYTDLLKNTPKIGAIVSTPEGKGTVVDLNLITQNLTVSLSKSPDAAPRNFKVSDVKVIKDAQIKVEKSELEQLKKLEKD